MILQSARHVMMMEPVGFHSNPETFDTNTYQAHDPADLSGINARAVAEFRAFRDMLVAADIGVTTVLGRAQSPDGVFCNNFVSTHAGGGMVLYPMLAPNRQIERRPDMLDLLGRQYKVILDLSAEEKNGRALESTGALALDRVNKRAYVALSPRTDAALARRWGQDMGFEVIAFNTRNHAGKPVYHTDVMMYVGTTLIGLCAEAIVEEDRDRVLGKARETHQVLLLSMDQMRAFCGNALELRPMAGDGRYLVMSARAAGALGPAQKETVAQHFDRGILSAPLGTIETYGGGSARCMLLEMH